MERLIELLYEKKTAKRLQTLAISFCKISNADFIKLVECISENRSLTSIDIQWNCFTSMLLQEELPPGATKVRMPKGKKKLIKKKKITAAV